jgi:hypothetical protein
MATTTTRHSFLARTMSNYNSFPQEDTPYTGLFTIIVYNSQLKVGNDVKQEKSSEPSNELLPVLQRANVQQWARNRSNHSRPEGKLIAHLNHSNRYTIHVTMKKNS